MKKSEILNAVLDVAVWVCVALLLWGGLLGFLGPATQAVTAAIVLGGVFVLLLEGIYAMFK